MSDSSLFSVELSTFELASDETSEVLEETSDETAEDVAEVVVEDVAVDEFPELMLADVSALLV